MNNSPHSDFPGSMGGFADHAVAPDPRTEPNFIAQYYPTANGSSAPIGGADPRNEAIAREFLAAYYAINIQYARLRELREPPAEPDRPRLERAALQAVECALIHRDALEDRYAPQGVLVEPVARSGFTVDLRFTFGSTNAAGRFRSEAIVSDAVLEFRAPKRGSGRNLTPPGSPRIIGTGG